MWENKLILSGIFMVLLFVAYTYLVFEFTDKIFDKKAKKKPLRVLLGLLNTGFFLIAMFLPTMTSVSAYIFMFVVLYIEFRFTYKQPPKQLYFIISAYVLHLMCVRSICTAILSVYTKQTIFSLTSDTFHFLLSTNVTFLTLNICIVLVMAVISAEKVRIITQHGEQINFMLSCVTVLNVYFLLNASIYDTSDLPMVAREMQIATPIFMLITIYIVLFFSFRMSQILGYKDRNMELEQAIYEEQQYRYSMTSEAVTVYEYNLTKNALVSGFEAYGEVLGEVGNGYDEVLSFIAKQVIYFEDLAGFSQYYCSTNMIEAFENGEIERSFSYRRLMPSGEYIWVKSTTNLMREMKTGDIKGFTYIKDIDVEKKRELALQFRAERDLMTGLYNKGTTEKLIVEYLQSPLYENAQGALFLIDVDNFKSINDHLGHSFGDMVLCELSEKLRKIFRDDDLVGRIGGDEFITLMKNIHSIDAVYAKAEEICRSFANTYTGENGQSYEVSASVGMVCFSAKNKSFAEIFKSADIALYSSKNKGKNTHCMYSGEAFTGYESNRTEIDTRNSQTQKIFHENRAEYVFKILFDAERPRVAISNILDFLAEHFEFSRGYLLEESPEEDGHFLCYREWCAPQISPKMKKNITATLAEISPFSHDFLKNPRLVVKEAASLSEKRQPSPPYSRFILQLATLENSRVCGLVGFEDSRLLGQRTQEEIEEITVLSNILTTFLMKQRAVERADSSKKSTCDKGLHG